MSVKSGAQRRQRATGTVPEAQGHIAGIPFDFRRPTVAKLKARWWNSADSRVFTPKSFGIGWDINWFWLAHPGGYLRGRSPRK